MIHLWQADWARVYFIGVYLQPCLLMEGALYQSLEMRIYFASFSLQQPHPERERPHGWDDRRFSLDSLPLVLKKGAPRFRAADGTQSRWGSPKRPGACRISSASQSSLLQRRGVVKTFPPNPASSIYWIHQGDTTIRLELEQLNNIGLLSIETVDRSTTNVKDFITCGTKLDHHGSWKSFFAFYA